MTHTLVASAVADTAGLADAAVAWSIAKNTEGDAPSPCAVALAAPVLVTSADRNGVIWVCISPNSVASFVARDPASLLILRAVVAVYDAIMCVSFVVYLA